ncbi:CopG family transcriptional regulator [Rhizobium wenxiniae]|uniref:type II toxin-antitoxin system BrnA family antitoxin n=1 Tax=Rhizobium wenxiniae TaxID=1737357 RepID=UPI001C6E2A03|nr:BrnA antitoxin family protein [Rhizobium wenxiniae]MBW9086523.1 CopG family transcriptional regulator [Rhizobium wenxiniae]
MKTITAEELDRKFDDGEDIDDHLDWSQARRGLEHFEPVEVALPLGVVNGLDRVAEKLDVKREILIQRWLEQKLQEYAGDGFEGDRDVAE